ncbi:MAG: hypothetical protein AAGC78_10335 [Cellvibrio sp.]|uniref:hypothetical protein n=1 Tax=Cellvibrio sp. TaxID=1965322 RepID=UPI0031A94951
MKRVIVGGVLLGLGALAFYLWRKDRRVGQVDIEIPDQEVIYDSPGVQQPVTTGSSLFDNVVSTVSSVLEKRGIRNNNPGNLIITNIKWNGKIPLDKNTDGKFEQFIDAHHGIRAMFMDVRGDVEKDGKNTIKKLITAYAPPGENNTASYIQAVVNRVGIGADTKILPAHYLNLLKAIIQHENGKQPYSDVLILGAMKAA